MKKHLKFLLTGKWIDPPTERQRVLLKKLGCAVPESKERAAQLIDERLKEIKEEAKLSLQEKEVEQLGKQRFSLKRKPFSLRLKSWKF